MALVLKDRVKQTAAAPGTGTITLGATAAGFQSFASVGNGNTTYFAIVDPISGAWEVNYGVYTSSGTTLTRNATPLSSSTGTLVNFTGAVDVFVTYPSENAVWRDTAGVVVQQSFGAITATSAALTSGTITGAPVNATDIVNKEYADSIASGLNYHQPVNYASTAALPAYTYNNGASGVGATITANANGALSLGGGSPTATQRVLVKDEVSGNAPYNGVYVVTQAGSAGTPFILTRASDYDTSGTGTNEIDQGDYVLVISGTLASTAWVQQTPLPITVGTTALTFLQFNAPITYTAGTGLNLSPATTFNISNTGVTATTYGSASAVPVVTFNAQGQATGVTNTTIAIAGSQVSGNITGQAGSVANALTLGTYLTGGTYNGSAAVTATVDATSANTASKVVARDASGNFSAGTITATLSGSSTSATTATNLAGGAANQIPYQTGSGTTTFATAPSASNQVLNWNGSAFTWSAGTISGVPLGSNLNSLTAGTYLTGTAYNGSAAQTWTVDATSANTASKVVARDASGNFSAGTITAALNGNASTATSATSATTAASSPLLSALGYYAWSGATLPTSYNLGIQCSFVDPGTWPSYGSVMTMNTYSGGGGALQMYVPYSPTYGGTGMQVRFGNYDVGSGNSWTSWKTLLASDNYNSYAPTLTGTGASGTWGINITGSSASTSGNAATASRVTGGNLNPAGETFNNSIVAASGNYRTVTFDGNGAAPSVWWSNGTRAYFAIDAVSAAGASIWANNGSSWQQQMQVNYGNVTINTDIRSPIFYDSDNTAYYVDPASNSRLFYLGVGNVTPDLPLSVNGAAQISSYLYMGGTAGSAGSWSGRMYSSSGATYINTSTFLVDRTGYGGGGSFSMDASGNSFASASFRAPIFYDSDNTAYYVDPNGTSNLAGSITIGGRTVYTTAAIYDNTASGNNIGIAFGSGILPTDGAGTVVNNSKALGSNSYTFSYLYLGSAAYAPLYYDISDTSFYVDPASTSSQKTILIGYSSASPYVYNVASTGYITFGTTSDPANYSIFTELENYSGNYSKLRFKWYTGIQHYASQAYGGHRFYDIDNTQYFGIGVGGNWSYSIYSHRAPIFYDLDNTGYYVDPNSTSSLYATYAYYYRRQSGGYGYLDGGYPSQETGGTSGPIYTIGGSYLPGSTSLGNMYGVGYTVGNISGIGIIGNWGFYVASNGVARIFLDSDAGVGYATGSFRASLFYDYDNTAYYGDFAGTSRMNSVLADVLYSYGNVTAYHSSDIKFKTNVRTIPNAIETVESIGGKLFDWNDEYIEEHGGEDGYFVQKEDFGVIAQDVQAVFPVAVRTRPDGSLAVDYEKLSALAFAAVAELSTRVKSLEARI